MLMSPVLFILLLAASVVNCQFYYNYEQQDSEDLSKNSEETIFRYNPPLLVNQRIPLENSALQNLNNARPNTETFAPETRPTSTPLKLDENLEETRTSKGLENRRPRKRIYRKITREGTYFETTDIPKIYGPSAFEGIMLGEAPNGVFVPPDSLLNILKNPARKQSHLNQYTNIQPFGIGHQFQTNQQFFTQANPSTEVVAQDNNHLVESNVEYVSSSSQTTPKADTHRDSNPNNSRTPASRRQRQKQQRKPPVEPVVDIDVFGSNSPIFPQDNQPIIINTQSRRTQTSRNRTVTTLSTEDSPSIFQNIGLGEAPNGVHIPADSLLNVLKQSSHHSGPDLPGHYLSKIQPQNTRTKNADQVEEPSSTTATDLQRSSRHRSRESTSRSGNPKTESRTNPNDSNVRATTSQQRRRQQSARNSVTRTESSSRQQSSDQQRRRGVNLREAKLAIATLPEDSDGDGIPGEANVDYPTLHSIPRTQFSCRQQSYKGYYADLETSCQVMHLCQDRGVQSSFLCPNGTIFSQEKFSCQWWYKVKCAESPKFYSINEQLYKVPTSKPSVTKRNN